MHAGIRVFIISLVLSIVYQQIELLAGIQYGFHPDSIYYIENYYQYTARGFFDSHTMNNGYFFVIQWLDANVALVVLTNQIIYSFTNVILFNNFRIKLSQNKIIHIFILFLPYRLHLSAHVLKDTIVICVIVLGYFSTVRWTPLLSFVLAVFRQGAMPILLLVRFMPERRIFVLAGLGALLLAVAFVPQFADYIVERADFDMGGRDYFDVPLSNVISFTGLAAKSMLWPVLSKTGLFALLSPHPVTLVLAIEPMVFCTWALVNGRLRDFATQRGTVAMAFIALLVTSYGAYFRYVYAFMLIDYVMVVRLRTKPVRRAGR